MNKQVTKILAITLICISSSGMGWAVEHPVDIHHQANMEYEGFGPVDKTYGYVNIVSNEDGKGFINVMFSNGRQTDWVKFNARVTFLDVSGAVIEETILHRWLGSAGSQGAAERKVTKPLKVADFDAITVDFYLSETQKTVVTMPDYRTEFTNADITNL